MAHGLEQPRLIVALDVDTAGEAEALLDTMPDAVWAKIGLQLFLAAGWDLVEQIRDSGRGVMLDLKLHDIPNTVAHAARLCAGRNVDLLTVHALGGAAMIEAAAKACAGADTQILAVTVLTSHSAEAVREELGLRDAPNRAVPRLATMATSAGAHGIVCSPLEIAAVREAVGADAAIVTPGIRPAAGTQDDQARTSTPRQAIEAGANAIVVGRPIVRAANPSAAAKAVLEEITP